MNREVELELLDDNGGKRNFIVFFDSGYRYLYDPMSEEVYDEKIRHPMHDSVFDEKIRQWGTVRNTAELFDAYPLKRGLDMDGCREFVADMSHHRVQVELFGRMTNIVKTATPWGPAQTATKYARGITFYSTAGHGGFKVSDGLNKQVPDALSNANGFYEEDCEYAIVVLTFPTVFTDREIRLATESLKRWYPETYHLLVKDENHDESPPQPKM